MELVQHLQVAARAAGHLEIRREVAPTFGELEIHNYTGMCPTNVLEVTPSKGSCACACQYCLVTDGNHAAPIPMGVALNEDGQEQAGMGLGIGDFNLDGRLDILKTHFTEDTPALYANGKTGFADVTIRSGLGVEPRYVSWGAAIADFDNNGWPDLFWVTGQVYPELEKKLSQFPYRTPRVLFRNLGDGRFEELMDEAGPGVTAAHSSRGLALGDFDNDGDVDLLVVNLNEPPSLLRNSVKGDNRWLKVKLVGVK